MEVESVVNATEQIEHVGVEQRDLRRDQLAAAEAGAKKDVEELMPVVEVEDLALRTEVSGSVGWL